MKINTVVLALLSCIFISSIVINVKLQQNLTYTKKQVKKQDSITNYTADLLSKLFISNIEKKDNIKVLKLRLLKLEEEYYVNAHECTKYLQMCNSKWEYCLKNH